MSVNSKDAKFFLLNCKNIDSHMKYEEYLLEVINHSDFFRAKCTFNNKFRFENKQSNGECDAISDNYNLDFKLLVDQEWMHNKAKNKPDVDYSKLKKGVIFVKKKNTDSSEYKSNFLTDIMNIKMDNLIAANASDQIKGLAKPYKMDKNLFIYYPHEYATDCEYAQSLFGKAFSEIMKGILDYRKLEQPSRDTFLCIKVNTDFLIYEWNGSEFLYRDKVHEIFCQIYCDTRDLSVY